MTLLFESVKTLDADGGVVFEENLELLLDLDLFENIFIHNVLKMEKQIVFTTHLHFQLLWVALIPYYQNPCPQNFLIRQVLAFLVFILKSDVEGDFSVVNYFVAVAQHWVDFVGVHEVLQREHVILGVDLLGEGLDFAHNLN